MAKTQLKIAEFAALAESKDNWASATDDQRARAMERLAIVERVEELLKLKFTTRDALLQVAAEQGISISTIKNYRRRIKRAGDNRLAAMLDAERSGRPTSVWGGASARWAWDLWCADFLRDESPDGAAVYRRIQIAAAREGHTIPPLPEFHRRTNKEISPQELTSARQGRIAAMQHYPPQERTVEGLAPLDIINGDGRRHDVMVTFPSGRIGRPTVWMFQDVRTRRILSYRIGETESADLIRTSLFELVEIYGVPKKMLIDNTLAASGKWLTGQQRHRKRWRSSGEEIPGVLRVLDIEYCTTSIDTDRGGRGVGRGQAKPIERAFGDLARQIDTHPDLAGSYTGRGVNARPETHREKTAEFEVFCQVVAAAVAEHNARPGRRTEAAAGESFDTAWAREYSRATIKRISKAQAALLLLAAEDVLIKRDGTFTLKTGRATGLPTNRYYAEALVHHTNKRLIARFDPDNLHDDLQMFNLDGRHICNARCLLPVGFADSGAASETNRLRRQSVRLLEQQTQNRHQRINLQAQLGAVQPTPPPQVQPGVVQLVVNGSQPVGPTQSSGGHTLAAIKRRIEEQ